MTRSDGAPPLLLGLIGRAHGLAGAFRVVGAAEWFTFAPGATLLLDGQPRALLSVAGTPQSPIVEIDADRARAWLAKGAQPSEPVKKLLKIAGV